MAEVLGMTPDELLTTTRSVRRRLDLDRPVSVDLVKDCLRIALQAPSGSNAQRWRWLLIIDPAQRAAIGGLYLRAWRRYAANGGISQSAGSTGAGRAGNAGDEPTDRRVIASAAHLAQHMGRVPVMVIPCLELPTADLPTGNQAGLWGSLLPAAWSYMLAARSRGLGTAWTTLHLQYEQEVADLLGLPARVRQGALIPTAHTIGGTFRPAGRHPLEDVLHVNRW
jgi:nitroreductase